MKRRGPLPGKIGEAFTHKREAADHFTPKLDPNGGQMNTLTANPKPNGQYPKQQGREIATIPPALKLRNILVPVDFSAASEKALSYAVPLARQFGAKITLLYVSQAQFHANEFAYLPIEEAAVSCSAKDRMNSIASRRIAPGMLGDTLVRNGVAFDEITRVAKEINADLIIVNTHGYTGLKHVLVGSTAERVVRHAPCPVLVVRDCEDEFP